MNEDLIAGIAPGKPEHRAPAVVKEFEPWHKPRKQFVRTEQWLREFDALLGRLRLEGRPLRYLSITDEDMFDIRVIANACNSRGINLKIIGFNYSVENPVHQEELERSISGNEIRSKPVIAPGSTIYNDNFFDLQDTGSVAYNNIKQFGSFDLINLDFCGSFFDENYRNNHKALLNLCDYQIQSRAEPWLLYITTRTDTTGQLPNFWEGIDHNITYSRLFLDKMKEVFGPQIVNSNDLKVDEAGFERLGISLKSKLIGLGFGKWLLRLLFREEEPHWLVAMLDSYFYRVYNPEPDMLSLAYLINMYPIELTDPSKVVETSIQYEDPDEERLSQDLFNKMCMINDLDRKMHEDAEKYEEMKRQTKELLEEARYNVSEYDAWVER